MRVDWSWAGDFASWWTAARVGGAAAAVGAVAASAGAISGVKALDQTRRDSKARSRPMVAAELQRAPHSKGVQNLVIRNYGPSVARKVIVAFDPPLPEVNDPESIISFLKARYAAPIPVLTPGMSLSNVYYVPKFTGSTSENYEPVADVFEVSITYEGDDGAGYKDVYPLNTDLGRKESYATSPTSPEAQGKEIIKSLRGIDASLKGVRHLAESRSSLDRVAAAPIAAQEDGSVLARRLRRVWQRLVR